MEFMATMKQQRQGWRGRTGGLILGAGLAMGLPVQAQRIFFEDFNGLPLGPNVEELSRGEKVWTKTPPAGWSIDDTGMPGFGDPEYSLRDGMREWAGWSFADVKWWPTVDNQRRSEFVRASGAAAIADPDEWDDAPHFIGFFNSYLHTPEITVTGKAANTLFMSFDSSWRPEGFDDGPPNWPGGPEGERINNQTAVITAQWDNGAEVEVFRWDSNSAGEFYKENAPNDAVLVPLQNPAGAQKLKLKIGMVEAANDWWWAFDNFAIGEPPMLTAVVGRGNGFTARIVEGEGKTVATGTPVTAKLNGQTVSVTSAPAQLEPPIAISETEVMHDQSPLIFPPGSVQTVELTYRTSDGRNLVETGTFIAPGYSSVRATPFGITATIQETDYLVVDESKGIQLQLNGQAITATSVTRQDLQATDGTDLPDRLVVFYAAPSPLPSGTSHTLKVTFTTTTSQVVPEDIGFTVPVYGTIPAVLATALGTGADAGMTWRTHQLAAGRPGGNNIAATEAQLAGEYGASLHDPSGEAAAGIFQIPFVNFEQGAGAAGNFSVNATIEAQMVADDLIPGILGLEGGTDNIAGEAVTFVEIPAPGVYSMVVNSDDGFQLSTGNATNPTFQVLGLWNAGRGASDSEIFFQVEQAGVYLFRLLWFEGGGGASVEWFTVSSQGNRALVNGTQPGALKSYRRRTVAEPTLPSGGPPTLGLQRDGAVIRVQYTGTLESAPSVNGPFTPVAGATSPFTLPVGTGAEGYYRAKQ